MTQTGSSRPPHQRPGNVIFPLPNHADADQQSDPALKVTNEGPTEEFATGGSSGGRRLEQAAVGTQRWQAIYRAAVGDPVELCQRLQLSESWHQGALRASKLFPLRVPEPYLQRIQTRDPFDPLLRQVLPLDVEFDEAPGYSADPLDEQAAVLVPGLLQKYAGRALLVTSGSCAVHCRYCFRRHFPYTDLPPGKAAWVAAVQQLQADPTISEVLLSGGDPLSLTDSALGHLVGQLEGVAHLRRLRIHTRFPTMIPQRATADLLELLRCTRLQVVIVLHINHRQEIDQQVAQMIDRFHQAGFWMFNQAVLLRGVNDTVDALTDLCLALVDLQVQPYYLHQLDRVLGTGHFEVSVACGLQLMAELRRRLPGYAMPRYVREEPGQPHKTVLA